MSKYFATISNFYLLILVSNNTAFHKEKHGYTGKIEVSFSHNDCVCEVCSIEIPEDAGGINLKTFLLFSGILELTEEPTIFKQMPHAFTQLKQTEQIAFYLITGLAALLVLLLCLSLDRQLLVARKNLCQAISHHYPHPGFLTAMKCVGFSP